VLAAEENLSIPNCVKPKPKVPVGEALTAAWDIFRSEGRGFWTGMDALVDILDGLVPA
jgi:type I restriction enzyme M protein